MVVELASFLHELGLFIGYELAVAPSTAEASNGKVTGDDTVARDWQWAEGVVAQGLTDYSMMMKKKTITGDQ